MEKYNFSMEIPMKQHEFITFINNFFVLKITVALMLHNILIYYTKIICIFNLFGTHKLAKIHNTNIQIPSTSTKHTCFYRLHQKCLPFFLYNTCCLVLFSSLYRLKFNFFCYFSINLNIVYILIVKLAQ